jgi:hypothetical protein
MPRLPINYSNTIIYKIVCNDLNITEVYVGHTTAFKERKSKHKQSCKNENNKDYNAKVYQYIRENGGWDNFSMIEIEKYPCNDFNEARARERYWYESLHPFLNERNPIRNAEEKQTYYKQHYILNQEHYKQYRENNKEKNQEYKKQYRIDNLEKVKEKAKHYREQNKEQLSIKQKEYNEKHKQEKKEYDIQYREQNRNKIKEKKKLYYQKTKQKQNM